MMISRDERVWVSNGNAVFCKAKDAFGSYGNMAGGYGFTDPSTGLAWKSSEAWYQAQRFEHLPALQEEIRGASNGFVAKQIAHARVKESRPDWLDVNVGLMARAIELKSTNARFAAELVASGTMEIVELSMRDAFWGAKPMGDGRLKGANVLGQLLMQRRAAMVQANPARRPGILGALAG